MKWTIKHTDERNTTYYYAGPGKTCSRDSVREAHQFADRAEAIKELRSLKARHGYACIGLGCKGYRLVKLTRKQPTVGQQVWVRGHIENLYMGPSGNRCIAIRLDESGFGDGMRGAFVSSQWGTNVKPVRK